MLSSPDEGRDGRDGDDTPSLWFLLLAHLPRDGLHYVERAVKVDAAGLFPRRVRDVEERVEGADSGVRDESVYSPVRGERGSDDPVGGRWIRNVAADFDRRRRCCCCPCVVFTTLTRTRDLLDLLQEAACVLQCGLGAEVVDDDAGACLSAAECDAAADALTRAGDDDDAVSKQRARNSHAVVGV